MDLDSNGGRSQIEDDGTVVQKNGKRTKVVLENKMKSSAGVPIYLVGVRFFEDEQLDEIPNLRNLFQISKLVEEVVG